MKRSLLFLGPIGLLAIWILLAYSELVSPLFVPSPWAVFSEIGKGVFSGTLLPDLGYTMIRVVTAAVCGVLVGVPIGALLGLFDRFYRSVEVLVDFFRSVPATALMPLFLLVFGIEEAGKVAIAAWAASFVIVINTMYGVRRTSKIRLLYVRSIGATRWQELTKVTMPDACPAIFVGIRTAISLSMIYIVVAEMFMGSTKGLGSKIYDAGMVSDTPGMYAGIILVGLTGYAINKIFVGFEKRFIHWTGR